MIPPEEAGEEIFDWSGGPRGLLQRDPLYEIERLCNTAQHIQDFLAGANPALFTAVLNMILELIRDELHDLLLSRQESRRIREEWVTEQQSHETPADKVAKTLT